MEIQDRIKMVMKMHNKNASQFADTIDVQRSSISHILSGRNKPSLDFIQKMLRNYPRVNADWLITGNTKINDPQQSKEEPQAEYKTKVQKEPKKAIEANSFNGSKEKKVEKILVFYTDDTFDAYKPNER